MAFTPILHHHDPSPFGEKIRKAFGIKGVSWNSVQVPMVMPKPDLTALTGGYRGTPVMQIGADIFCDTRCIIAEIERHLPDPPLFTSGPLVNFAAQHWSDDIVFPPGAALSMFENREHIPNDIIEDRKEYFINLNFDRFDKDAPHYRNQLQAHFALIEQQLSDGRAYLTGDKPEWIDIGAWMNDFMARGNIPSHERLFSGMNHLITWRERMDAFGTGQRSDIAIEEAFQLAQTLHPMPVDDIIIDETGLTAGQSVMVIPMDHPDTPIKGVLRLANQERIVIERETAALGRLGVHFPRIGYRVIAV